MGAGRPGKSIAQKFADGTFRADRANLHEPVPSPFEEANPFDPDLDVAAWKMWEYVVPELIDRYNIGKGERHLVHAYCLFYGRATATDEELTNLENIIVESDRGLQIHPLTKLSESCWDRVIKFGSLLGLDPINRKRVRGPKNGPRGIAEETLTLAGRARDRELGPDDDEPPLTTGDPLVDSL